MLPLFIALLLVAANAFFVAAEFALAKVRPSSLEALASQGDGLARRALGLTKSLEAYLGACQLGITFASLALGWIGEPAIAVLIMPYIEELGLPPAYAHGAAVTIALSILTLLHIVVGEQVPKVMAIRRAETFSRWTALPLRGFLLATYPALVVLNGLSAFTLRLFRLPAPNRTDGKLSPEEMRVVIRDTFEGNVLDERKRDLLERVLRTTDRPVRAIMVPRVDMVTIALDAKIETCLEVVKKQGFSRYPVAEGGEPDRVVGYIYVKDILVASPRPTDDVKKLLRDVIFVPETQQVGELMTQFQLTAIPIAIVVDEYGGTSGMVTLEDVVEQFVGEIQDEHDAEGPRMIERTDGTFVVDGTLPISDVQLDGLALPEENTAETVGGQVIAMLGRLALPGDRVRLGAYDAVVEQVRRRRVSRVALVRRIPTSIPPPPPQESAD